MAVKPIIWCVPEYLFCQIYQSLHWQYSWVCTRHIHRQSLWQSKKIYPKQQLNIVPGWQIFSWERKTLSLDDSSQPCTVSSNAFEVRPVRTNEAPKRENSLAVAAPMPDDAPGHNTDNQQSCRQIFDYIYIYILQFTCYDGNFILETHRFFLSS